MEEHLIRNILKPMKRHSNMNDLFFSTLSNNYGKQARLDKDEILKKKTLHSSSSYTSLNSYLKEFDLSENDFVQLQKALKTLFHYFKSQIMCNESELINQRLTSPYLKQCISNENQSFLPLYTNEYFIRNGLLNHNDGPDIYDNIFQSNKFTYSDHSGSVNHYHSPPSSSVNISLPLALLSNQKYFSNAMTSNFISEKTRYSCSSMDLNMFKYNKKGDSIDKCETESTRIRRNKVKTWERENTLHQRSSIDYNDSIKSLEYNRSSILRTSSTYTDERMIKNTQAFTTENSSSLPIFIQEEKGNDKLLNWNNVDDLFPMVKKLAPYIIIRDSFHINSTNDHPDCIRSMNIDNTNNEKSVGDVNLSTKLTGKSSSNDRVHSSLLASNQPSVLVSSDNRNQNHQIDTERKKIYLPTECQSVLTQISKP